MAFTFIHVLCFIIAIGILVCKLLVTTFVFKSVFGKGVSPKEAVVNYLEHQKEDKYYRIHRAKGTQEEKK